MPSSDSTHQEAASGFIVVAVLWVLGALATLAAMYAIYVLEAASASVDRDKRLRAQELAMAGVELAVYQLSAIPEARRSRGRLSFRLGNGNVRVSFRSESALIDLNLAPKAVLAGLFTVLGVENQDAERFADRIVAWRTPMHSPTTDSEASLYRVAGKSYGPRRGPFQHTHELGLVLGLPANLVDRALPFLTVYSGQAEVNVVGAGPEVLGALPGMTPKRLEILLAQRESAPQDILKAHLGVAAQYATFHPGKAARVIVDVRLDTNFELHSEAIVLPLNGDVEPFRFLSWHDEVVEPSTAREHKR